MPLLIDYPLEDAWCDNGTTQDEMDHFHEWAVIICASVWSYDNGPELDDYYIAHNYTPWPDSHVKYLLGLRHHKDRLEEKVLDIYRSTYYD